MRSIVNQHQSIRSYFLDFVNSYPTHEKWSFLLLSDLKWSLLINFTQNERYMTRKSANVNKILQLKWKNSKKKCNGNYNWRRDLLLGLQNLKSGHSIEVDCFHWIWCSKLTGFSHMETLYDWPKEIQFFCFIFGFIYPKWLTGNTLPEVLVDAVKINIGKWLQPSVIFI